MTDLPSGWEWATLGEVASISGGISKQPSRAPRGNAYPFLRVANVLDSRLDLKEIHRIELFAGELDRFRLIDGDLLVVEGNGSASQIGRAALWSGQLVDCVHQNHLIRVRSIGIDPSFLAFLWRSRYMRSQLESVAASTSGLYTLSTKKVASLRIPFPPLAEQKRISDALSCFSDKIANARKYIESAFRKQEQFRRAVVSSEFLQLKHRDCDTQAVGQVCETALGKMLDRGRPSVGRRIRYLRNADVQWGAINVDNLPEINIADDEIDRFAVANGDLLVCEGGEIGRCAIWTGGSHEVTFQKALHRIRPVGAILPEYLAYAMRWLSDSGQLAAVSTGSTIRHLPQVQLRRLQVPVPSVEVQRLIVDRLDAALAGLTHLGDGVRRAGSSSDALSEGLLRQALSGDLVSQDPDDEPARVLLDRIRGRRAVAPRGARRRSDASRSTGRA